MLGAGLGYTCAFVLFPVEALSYSAPGGGF